MKEKILITGVAGFIGFSLAKELLKNKKFSLIGIDNFDNYYSVKLKKERIKHLKKFQNFRFYKTDISNFSSVDNLFRKNRFIKVFNFAAQAGVRYSIKNPKSYLKNNINGFFNILECCRIKPPKTIYYASSSSVYGDLKKYPANEKILGSQKNAYSLSKKFNEDLAEVYSKIYNLKLVGLRFFTVYGEWGRPDMFYLNYFKSMVLKKTIKIFNHGNHYRDFTYIKDVIEILCKLMKKNLKSQHEVFNICSNNPINLMKFIHLMNDIGCKKTKIKKIKLQKADVIKTHGDNSKLLRFIKKNEFYSVKQGLKNTYEWFLKYKKII